MIAAFSSAVIVALLLAGLSPRASLPGSPLAPLVHPLLPVGVMSRAPWNSLARKPLPPLGPVTRAAHVRNTGDELARRTLDELDAVAVGIADEAQARAALAHRVRGLLGLDALLGQPTQRPVQVVHRDRHVVVAGAQVVGVHADVVGQLQPRAVARQAHERVDRP